MTALRLRVATQFGQTVDEAHYVLYGKFLDLSYFDHPPLVGWTHSLFQLLPLNDLLKARFPALLISLFTSDLVHKYLTQKNVSQKNSMLAVIALNLTPMFNAMSVALLPDTLLMPLTLLIVNTTEKILLSSTIKNWLLLGLFLGLAGLSKYTAVLYVVALVIVFIYKNKFNELLKINLWTGAALALTLVSPVLFWNLQHNFISFKYQVDHVSNLESSVLKNMATSFSIQMFSWGVGPFLLSLGVFFVLFKNLKSLRSHLISIIYLTIFLIFFTYVSVSEVLLPHWMLIFFILMIPISISHLLERSQLRYTVFVSVVVSGLLSLALLFELAFKVFPIQWTAGLYEGVTGWQEMVDEANIHLQQVANPKKALAVMNWTLGSRAMYYNKSGASVFVIDTRYDQFDIWTPESSIGYDLIAMIESNKKDEHFAHLNCQRVDLVGEKITTIKNIPVNHFLYYHCANFLGYK